MFFSHVAPEPLAGATQLRLLGVRLLPRTALDWERSAIHLACLLVPFVGVGPHSCTIQRVPGVAGELLLGPLPAPLGVDWPDSAQAAPRVLTLTVALNPDDAHGFPARLSFAPFSGTAASGPMHDLIPPYRCVVEVSGAPGDAPAGRDAAESKRLARSRKVGERVAVAADPSTPAEVLDLLARDSSPAVRRAVAGNHRAGAEALSRLAGDERRRIREEVAVNPAAGSTLLARLLGDPDWQVRWSVLDNPAVDDDSVRAAAVHEDRVVRQQVAARPAVPFDVTVALLHDPEREVRAHLAAFTADTGALAALVRDPQAEVRARATENSLLTTEQLSAFAIDRSALVRGCLAFREDLPVELRERLARDRSVHVRWTLAHLPQPPSVRAILLEDSIDDVRHGAAQSESSAERQGRLRGD